MSMTLDELTDLPDGHYVTLADDASVRWVMTSNGLRKMGGAEDELIPPSAYPAMLQVQPNLVATTEPPPPTVGQTRRWGHSTTIGAYIADHDRAAGTVIVVPFTLATGYAADSPRRMETGDNLLSQMPDPEFSLSSEAATALRLLSNEWARRVREESLSEERYVALREARVNMVDRGDLQTALHEWAQGASVEEDEEFSDLLERFRMERLMTRENITVTLSFSGTHMVDLDDDDLRRAANLNHEVRIETNDVDSVEFNWSCDATVTVTVNDGACGCSEVGEDEATDALYEVDSDLNLQEWTVRYCENCA